MSLVIIDGIDLPEPTIYGIPDSDLDSENSIRNELAVLQRDQIRQGVFKIELAWEKITSSQLATIKAAVKPASIKVKFLTEIGFIEKTMYASDRNTRLAACSKDYKETQWNISFNLTEF